TKKKVAFGERQPRPRLRVKIFHFAAGDFLVEPAQTFFRNRKIAAFREGQDSFEAPEIERLWIDRQGAVHNPIRRLEVSYHLIIEKQILERPGILWVEAGRFFEVGSRLLP